MPIISIDLNGNISFDDPADSVPLKREHKGKNRIAFPSDYTVIDLETTGLDPFLDDIIEVAALRVRDGQVTDSFSSLVKPCEEIDKFITELTEITPEMLADAPSPKEVFPSLRDFLGEDILVGHNVNFDVNFLYDQFDLVLHEPFRNDFIDLLRLSRKALPGMPHYCLEDVAKALEVSPDGFHRALCDCQTTFECFRKLYARIQDSGNVEEFIKSFHHHSPKTDLLQITSNRTEFDETHPLFGRYCVFTGKLEKMTRAEAAQIVVNFGGFCENTVTKKTNFLVLGNNDYCKAIKDGKSAKQKKAEEYKLNGYDIEIITENVFYDMLDF